MDIKEALKELTGSIGVSGYEKNALFVAEKYLSKYGKVSVDTLSSIICEIDGTKSGHILLDAHIDQIGLIVTDITENGFVRVAACGGIDRRILCGQTVTIHGREDIFGVIASTPPHLQGGDNLRKSIAMDKVLIDTGFASEKLKNIISLGDRITINSDFSELLNNRVVAAALDDRAGIVSILYALSLLEGKPHKKITVVFSSREETSEAGAKVASFTARADEFIAVDVSFAKTPDSNEVECGEIGKGVMIGIAPSLSYEMSEQLKKIAMDKQIPYQLEIMGGKTGTNADQMTISRGGMKSSLLSIPLKYMHTGIEVVSIDDVKSVGTLMAEYILFGGSNNA
ncbi:MAG: M42 family peptidase [Oscillospiraceae bacterium]